MVLSFPLRRHTCRMCPTGLAAGSVSSWYRESVQQVDLDTHRHHGLSPASLRKQSTHYRLLTSRYPTSPPCHRRSVMDVIFTHCAGLDVHKKTVWRAGSSRLPRVSEPMG